jgi:hypothetical protein
MTVKIKKGAGPAEIKAINEQLSKQKAGKGGFDAYKHCGTIKLKEDPLVIQKRLRNEWK